MATVNPVGYTDATMRSDTTESPAAAGCATNADQAPLPPSLCRWTGVLLSRATQRLRDRAEIDLAPFGIRTRHYPVLAVLEDVPLTQVEIGKMLWVDRSTMVALIDELEHKRLVTRDRHPADRRAYAISLTDEGREVLRLATEQIAHLEADCFSALTSIEQQQLRSLLTRLL